jgi:hypothetical protein
MYIYIYLLYCINVICHMCNYMHVWHRCCHIYMYLDTQFTQSIYENTSTITGDLRWNTYFNLLIEGQSMVFEQRGCISAQYLRSYLPTCLPRCASTVLAQEAGCRPDKRPIVTTPQEKPLGSTIVLGKGAQWLNTCRGPVAFPVAELLRETPSNVAGGQVPFFPDQRMQIGGFQFPGEIRGLLGYFKWQWGNISPT